MRIICTCFIAEFPDPVIEIAVEPKTKADVDKLGIGLAKLAEEDPTFQVRTDIDSGQTVISGMGELHLEILLDRLKREFKVECTQGEPQVNYKEAVSLEVEHREVFKKQSGGRGKFADIVFELGPVDAEWKAENPDKLISLICTNLKLPADKKMEFLMGKENKSRLENLAVTIEMENEVITLKNNINGRVKMKLEKTQKELAELLGSSLKAVSSYEQGWRSIPAHIERQLFFLLIKQRNDAAANLERSLDHWKQRHGHEDDDAGEDEGGAPLA